jgi:hypothetical protein
LITSLTSDEARREAVISRMCEKPGFDREKVETVLEHVRRRPRTHPRIEDGDCPAVGGIEWEDGARGARR